MQLKNQQFQEDIMNKPLSLVTGAAGFIGSNLTDYLIRQGHQVICVDNKSADNEKFH